MRHLFDVCRSGGGGHRRQTTRQQGCRVRVRVRAIMAGVKKIGQYSLGETLGTGSFGKVKRTCCPFVLAVSCFGAVALAQGFALFPPSLPHKLLWLTMLSLPLSVARVRVCRSRARHHWARGSGEDSEPREGKEPRHGWEDQARDTDTQALPPPSHHQALPGHLITHRHLPHDGVSPLLQPSPHHHHHISSCCSRRVPCGWLSVLWWWTAMFFAAFTGCLCVVRRSWSQSPTSLVLTCP